MKKINGYEFIQLFEEFAPKEYALEGDPIGLQIGTLNKPIQNVMVALDVLEEVVQEAVGLVTWQLSSDSWTVTLFGVSSEVESINLGWTGTMTKDTGCALKAMKTTTSINAFINCQTNYIDNNQCPEEKYLNGFDLDLDLD